MRSLLPFVIVAIVAHNVSAHGVISFNSRQTQEAIAKFREIADITTPPGSTAGATECGYIFPGDSSKFGCKGSGRAAADVAAACSGGGQLACTGSGTSRTCTCAFD